MEGQTFCPTGFRRNCYISICCDFTMLFTDFGGAQHFIVVLVNCACIRRDGFQAEQFEDDSISNLCNCCWNFAGCEKVHDLELSHHHWNIGFIYVTSFVARTMKIVLVLPPPELKPLSLLCTLLERDTWKIYFNLKTGICPLKYRPIDESNILYFHHYRRSYELGRIRSSY